MFINFKIGMVRVYGGIFACAVAILVFLLSNNKMKFKFDFKFSVIKNYIKFASPLIAIEIMGWFIISYDHCDLEIKQLSVYALAIQIASVCKLTQAGMLKSVSIHIFEKAKLNYSRIL